MNWFHRGRVDPSEISDLGDPSEISELRAQGEIRRTRQMARG